jgi:hypothetical protein
MAAYNYIDNSEKQRTLLSLIVIAALIYALPSLWEIRMSPQLHKNFYGYFPHSWRQTIRQGGFRPVVFLGHGLYISAFFSLALAAAAILWKTKYKTLGRYGILITAFLIVVLLLSKSWGGVIYGLMALIIIRTATTKTWMTAALVIALFVGSYPLLRSSDTVPTEKITAFFIQYSEDRAQSLQFRFDNEDQLLEKANTRSLFGWGSWGRPRIYDPVSGRDLSVQDGTWIIIYGASGWLGYITVFGLLILPIIQHWRLSKKTNTYDTYTTGLCFILAINLIDLLPNSSLNPLTFILAGSLLGSYRYKLKANLNQ